MTEATLSTAVVDPAALPEFDYITMGFEAVTAKGAYLEFHATADPLNGWNIAVTGPDSLMREIEALVLQRAGLEH
jgi:hypothetical protein